jgi:hypothetical protein
MTKRGWIGDTKCRFCEGEENIHHLFFLCPPAKYMWSMVTLSVGTEDIPDNFKQYFAWIAKFATKKLSDIHVVGLQLYVGNCGNLQTYHVLKRNSLDLHRR